MSEFNENEYGAGNAPEAEAQPSGEQAEANGEPGSDTAQNGGIDVDSLPNVNAGYGQAAPEPQSQAGPYVPPPAQGYAPPAYAPYVQNPYQPPGGYYAQPNQYRPPYAAPYPTAPAKKKSSGLAVFAVIAVAVTLSFSLLAFFVSLMSNGALGGKNASTTMPAASYDNADIPTQATPDAIYTTQPDGRMAPEDVAARVRPAVVGVLVYKGDGYLDGNMVGEGSGCIISADGWILTCAHVVMDETGAGTGGISVQIEMADGAKFDAVIWATDSKTDLALLKVDKTGLPVIPIGDPGKLKPGEQVMSVGNPGGSMFAGSVTVGVVSAVDRVLNPGSLYQNKCIQHDAAISPGNSGGALVNMLGQLVGINSSKIVDSSFEGMGFAIPMDIARPVIRDLKNYKYVPNRPKLGITLFSANDYSYMYQNGVTTDYPGAVRYLKLPAGSVVIYSIDADSALKGTNAREGDMILSVNDKDLTDTNVLFDAISGKTPGTEITLGMGRLDQNGGISKFTVTCKLVEDKGDKNN